MRVALEAGAEDVVPSADHSVEVLADPFEFDTVCAVLTHRGFAPATAEVTQRAATALELCGRERRADGAAARGRSRTWTKCGTCIRMSRYRTKCCPAYESGHGAAMNARPPSLREAVPSAETAKVVEVGAAAH